MVKPPLKVPRKQYWNDGKIPMSLHFWTGDKIPGGRQWNKVGLPTIMTQETQQSYVCHLSSDAVAVSINF